MMHLKRKHCGLLIISAGLLFFAFKPGDPLKERIQKSLQAYLQYFPQEKIYLQLDKDYYAAGSTIWYKSYITRDHLPTNFSSVLYVELINKKGIVLQRDKLPIKDGCAWGSFRLDPDMSSDDYRIRAFTQWMLNFDPGYLFERDIHVFMPGKEAPPVDTTSSTDFAVQFFPEGGDLVDSVQSLVAFKAIGTDGLPVEVKGTIRDDQGNVIDTVSSVHDGMGSFTFTPLPGHAYNATMTTQQGTTKTFNLPQAKAAGVILHVIPVGNDKVFFEVMKNVKTGQMFDKLNLAGQVGGHLVYFTNLDFSQGLIGGLVPINEDPSGILQLTLFTPDGVPLAERLVYVKNDSDLIKLNLQEDSISLQPRGKNEFTLQLPDMVRGHFSVSVTDADQVEQLPSQDNIISNLLLNSDLKGNVYNPAWYFQKDDSITEHALDLVMLTNGWRRFVWQQFLNEKYPETKFPPELKGIQISGQAFDRKGPLKGVISMFLKAPHDSLTYYISGKAEENGFFEVNELNFHDTANLYYKGTDTLHKGRNITLKFTPNPFERGYVRLHNPIRTFLPPPGPSLQNYLELAKQRNQVDKYMNAQAVLLKGIKVTAKKITEKEKLEDNLTTGMFKSDNGFTFKLTDQDISYLNIFQYLQGRVAGLIINGDPMKPQVSWRGEPVGFFLDEVPVSASDIANVSVPDVALIKAYRPPFLGNFNGQNGAIAVYTRRGGIHYPTGRAFESKQVLGYTVKRQFYSPDYSVNKKLNELPDNRATLYWNPNLTTDSISHQVSFSFYNTDITKRMRITIEGIDNEGRIGRMEKVISGGEIPQ